MGTLSVSQLFLIITLLIAPVYAAEAVLEKATFAGGCFWCVEHAYEHDDAIRDVISGYIGGHKANPTYKEVSSGRTGHFEAVQFEYDPSKITYGELLDIFWRQINPTDDGGQFGDRGMQYLTAIFYHSEDQRTLAERSRKDHGKSGRYKKPIVTKILPATVFYTAEDYHQDYYKKNPIRYKIYRYYSGRNQYLEKVWGSSKDTNDMKRSDNYMKPSREEIKKKLTPLQYKVTQEDGTERAFDNEYWDNKREGIYVDIVSGEPLFSSGDKFKSGTGWPSFTKPLEPENITEKKDRTLFMTRTEIRSKHGDSHLGHVFTDGPEPTGLRYCMNSASLRFIPREDLAKEGYGDYQKLFNN